MRGNDRRQRGRTNKSDDRPVTITVSAKWARALTRLQQQSNAGERAFHLEVNESDVHIETSRAMLVDTA